MNARAKHSHRGFTLLEAVLVLGMVAAISVALYGAMYTGLKARTVAQLQSADLRTATIAMDLIDHDLQSVMMPTGALAGPFYGESGGVAGREASILDFYTLGRDYGSDSVFSDGFRRVVYQIRQQGTSSQLIREVTRNLLTDGEPEVEDEVVADDVLGFSVGYYDSTNQVWNEEWSSTDLENAMPTMVQVTVRIKKADPKLVDQTYSISRYIYLPCGGAAPTTTTGTGAAG